jgi:hypothetical protein
LSTQGCGGNLELRRLDLGRTREMTHTTPELRSAAERLLALEMAVGKRTAIQVPAAVRVSERLRHVLSTLLGKAGYRALLARALALAKVEAPALEPVLVEADGSLEGLSVVHDGKRRFADGEVILVGHVLGLLVTFIGEALMLRLVNETWPKARLDDLDFDKGTSP